MCPLGQLKVRGGGPGQSGEPEPPSQWTGRPRPHQAGGLGLGPGEQHPTDAVRGGVEQRVRRAAQRRRMPVVRHHVLERATPSAGRGGRRCRAATRPRATGTSRGSSSPRAPHDRTSDPGRAGGPGCDTGRSGRRQPAHGSRSGLASDSAGLAAARLTDSESDQCHAAAPPARPPPGRGRGRPASGPPPGCGGARVEPRAPHPPSGRCGYLTAVSASPSRPPSLGLLQPAAPSAKSGASIPRQPSRASLRTVKEK